MEVRIDIAERAADRRTREDTRWSLIGAAAGERPGRALDELCARYWSACYAYVRCCGVPPARAVSLVAAFLAGFAGTLRHLLRTERRRFRDLLLEALARARAEAWRGLAPTDDPARVPPLAPELLEDRYLAAVRDGDRPERAFAACLSDAMMARCLQRLADESARHDRRGLMPLLLPLLLDPNPDTATAARAAVAARTGLTPAAVAFALAGLRDRLRRLIDDELAAADATIVRSDGEAASPPRPAADSRDQASGSAGRGEPRRALPAARAQGEPPSKT